MDLLSEFESLQKPEPAPVTVAVKAPAPVVAGPIPASPDNRVFSAKPWRLACSIVSKLKLHRSSKPILSMALVSGNKISMTNLETAVTLTMPDSVPEPVVVSLPVLRKLLGANRSAAAFRFESKDRKLTFTIGGVSTTLFGEDPEEFPAVAAPPADGAAIPAINFAAAVEAVAFAAAAERSRFAFNGVRFDCSAPGDQLHLVATDGKRMVVREVRTAGSFPFACGHIVPTASLDVIQALIKESPGLYDLRVWFDERMMYVSGPSWTVTSRLVDGAFPKYQSVIPRDFVARVSAPRGEWLHAAKNMRALLSIGETSSVSIRANGDRIAFTARVQDVGESAISVAATHNGEPVEFGINVDFLIEGIEHLSGDTITLCFSGKDTPCLIAGADSLVQSVIMPATMRNPSAPNVKK